MLLQVGLSMDKSAGRRSLLTESRLNEPKSMASVEVVGTGNAELQGSLAMNTPTAPGAISSPITADGEVAEMPVNKGQ